MSTNYNFFYDLSYEDFENEDDDLHILYDKQYRNYKHSHKLHVMRLDELKKNLKQIEKNLELLRNM